MIIAYSKTPNSREPKSVSESSELAASLMYGKIVLMITFAKILSTEPAPIIAMEVHTIPEKGSRKAAAQVSGLRGKMLSNLPLAHAN